MDDPERIRISIEIPRIDLPVFMLAVVTGEHVMQQKGATPAQRLISRITNEMITTIAGYEVEDFEQMSLQEAAKVITDVNEWAISAEDLGPNALSERVNVEVEYK